MNLATFIATTIAVWCFTWLFIVPIGATPPKNPEPGHDAGAPENPRLLPKAIISGALALIIMTITHFLMLKGIINFEWVVFGLSE